LHFGNWQSQSVNSSIRKFVNPSEVVMGLQPYLILSAVVFCIGLFGVTTRRNTIGILLGIELMMNAVNINLVAFARYTASVSGMVFTVFTISITVTEAALGLAIVILLFRVRRTVMADHLDLLKG
jgi:NADH-quinone oxidoreductase subunit K